ncbi:hypothetical protein [Phytoactinopolyspora limicola]|uniref:hypothetical protein n=1 Tax=Phytoactinopolyspora limicola TaxID=2715536 RepID=UPI0014082FA1|nr:hypothetical protein [Phytoactinopolyspora limicola]
MAMTPDPQHESRSDGAATPQGDAVQTSKDTTEPELDTRVVDRAASALRAYTDHGWNRASPRILDQILSATRRSRPIQARGATGTFHVSDQVATAYLREAIDEVAGAEATHIGLELDDDVLVAVRLAVAVDYPRAVYPLADEVRRAARRCLKEVLGSIDPAPSIDVDVHIFDVNPPPELS